MVQTRLFNTKPYPAPVQTAIDRGKTVTKELVGRHLKCRYCESPDAYVQVVEGRYKVFCPVCQSESYLKTY